MVAGKGLSADWMGAYAGRTVLVTGDTGFKGSWLALWLTELGAKVVGYALPPVRPEDNYFAAGVDEVIAHHDGDIRDVAGLTRLFAETQPDIVFHLAAQSLVLQSYREPGETFDVNVQGTVAVLEAMRATPSVQAGIIVTTDKCYDNHQWPWPYRETDALGGHDPYSASKACAELVTASYRAAFFGGGRVATARAGNVIGAGDWADNRVVPDCVRALREGVPIVMRHPQAVRPWQHVLEPLRGYLMLGARLLTGSEGERASVAEAWNFGPASAEQVPVERLVAAAIARWGSGSAVAQVRDGAPREAQLLALDISKARTRLSWAPVLSFQETVALTIDGYRVDGAPADVRRHRLDQIAAYLERVT